MLNHYKPQTVNYKLGDVAHSCTVGMLLGLWSITLNHCKPQTANYKLVVVAHLYYGNIMGLMKGRGGGREGA